MVGSAVGGLALVGALIYFGAALIPENHTADIKRFKALQGVLEELERARSGSALSAAEYKTLQEKIGNAADPVAAELKDLKDPNPNQKKLQAMAKRMQTLSKGDFGATPNPSEKTLLTLKAELEKVYAGK